MKRIKLWVGFSINYHIQPLVDLIRKYGNEVLDKIQFKSCNDTVKAIISIVADYIQERYSATRISKILSTLKVRFPACV